MFGLDRGAAASPAARTSAPSTNAPAQRAASNRTGRRLGIRMFPCLSLLKFCPSAILLQDDLHSAPLDVIAGTLSTIGITTGFVPNVNQFNRDWLWEKWTSRREPQRMFALLAVLSELPAMIAPNLELEEIKQAR